MRGGADIAFLMVVSRNRVVAVSAAGSARSTLLSCALLALSGSRRAR